MRRVSEFAIYALAILIPVMVVPVGLAHPFDLPKVLVLLAGVGLLAIINPEPLKRIPAPVVLLLLLNAISLIYTKNLEYTIHFGALNVACLLLIVYTAEYINTPEKAKRLLACICFGGLITTLPAFFQYQRIPLIGSGTTTPIGLVGNANFFGNYLLFPITCVAGLFFLEEKKRNKYGLILIGLVFFTALLMARCRSSWLGFGIMVIPFIWFVPRKKELAVALCFVMVVTLSIMATIFPKSFLHWTETDTLRYRIKYWKAAEYIIRQNSIYGSGIESYRNLIYSAQAKVGEIDKGYWPDYVEPKPRHVHNQYLEILVDGGLIAAGLLVWFLWFFLKPAWKIISECPGEKRLVVGTAFFSVVAMMVGMLFYFPLKEPTSLCMVGLMFGLMAGISGVTKKLQVTLKNPWFVRTVIAVFAMIIVSEVAIKPLLADHYSQKAINAQSVDESVRNVTKCLKYMPNSSEYWQHLGMIVLFQKRDPQSARELFERALHPFNGNIVAWAPHYYMAICSLILQKPQEAIASLNMALHYNPIHEESQVLLAKATQLAKAQRIKDD